MTTMTLKPVKQIPTVLQPGVYVTNTETDGRVTISNIIT